MLVIASERCSWDAVSMCVQHRRHLLSGREAGALLTGLLLVPSQSDLHLFLLPLIMLGKFSSLL